MRSVIWGLAVKYENFRLCQVKIHKHREWYKRPEIKVVLLSRRSRSSFKEDLAEEGSITSHRVFEVLCRDIMDIKHTLWLLSEIARNHQTEAKNCRRRTLQNSLTDLHLAWAALVLAWNKCEQAAVAARGDMDEIWRVGVVHCSLGSWEIQWYLHCGRWWLQLIL